MKKKVYREQYSTPKIERTPEEESFEVEIDIRKEPMVKRVEKKKKASKKKVAK